MAKPSIVWHYTVGEHLEDIVAEGWIRLTMVEVPENERPAVWFSSNPQWEVTANKRWREDDGTARELNREETHERGGGLARIAVSIATAPHDWLAFQRLSGIEERHAKKLASEGFKRGASWKEWFVSFDPVPREKWLAVEVWDGNAWQPHAPQPSGHE